LNLDELKDEKAAEYTVEVANRFEALESIEEEKPQVNFGTKQKKSY